MVCNNGHDTTNLDTNNTENTIEYYETPYSLLDRVSPGYRQAFGDNLAKQLRKLSEEQNK